MTIKLIGHESPPITRLRTGFYSFDRACRNNRDEWGLALPAYIELYGTSGVGKTAVATTLGGIIAAAYSKNIAFLDWEYQDMQTIVSILESNGWSGELDKILEEKDEDSIDRFYKRIKDDDYAVGIMDSIAAFIAQAEDSGKQSDVIMGKRALNMAKFSRRSIRYLQFRESPFAVICTNHQYPRIGAMTQGMDTVGGDAKKFLATYRIAMKQYYWGAKHKVARFDEGWVIEGRMDKSRMGYSMTNFHVFMVMGEGLHLGLSALWDCLIEGHATYTKSVKMDGKSYGSLPKIVRKRDDDELFYDFISKLKSEELESKEDEEDIDVEEENE